MVVFAAWADSGRGLEIVTNPEDFSGPRTVVRFSTAEEMPPRTYRIVRESRPLPILTVDDLLAMTPPFSDPMRLDPPESDDVLPNLDPGPLGEDPADDPEPSDSCPATPAEARPHLQKIHRQLILKMPDTPVKTATLIRRAGYTVNSWSRGAVTYLISLGIFRPAPERRIERGPNYDNALR